MIISLPRVKAREAIENCILTKKLPNISVKENGPVMNGRIVYWSV